MVVNFYTYQSAHVCGGHGLLMVSFATGCIFVYDAQHPEGSWIGFTQEDKANFAGSFYLKTKAMVEELLKEFDNRDVEEEPERDMELHKHRVVSYNEIPKMYKAYIDPNFKWANFTLEEQAKMIVAPGSNNEMDATKLKRELPESLPIKQSLVNCVFELSKRT